MYSCQFQSSWRAYDGEIKFTKRKVIALDRLDNEVRFNWSNGNGAFHTIHLEKEGEKYYPFLILDFDSNYLNEALESVLKIISFLKENNLIDSCEVFFSGNKGFHIYIDSRVFLESSTIPHEKAFSVSFQLQIANFFNDNVLKNNDVKVDIQAIGNNRTIRSPNSINLKSGLNKVFLSYNELFNLEIYEIIEIAKNIRATPFSNDKVSYSGFKDGPINKLWNLFTFQSLDFEKKVKSNKKQKNEEVKTTPQGGASLYNVYNVVDKCRALRQLQLKLITSGKITAAERHYFAAAIVDTDRRKRYIHEIFGKLDGYQEERTELELDRRSKMSTNCQELIQKKICTNPCERYLIKDLSESISPNYFGVTKSSLFHEITSPNNILDVAHRLLSYHSTTTDIFDWKHANEFFKNQISFSNIISDNLRKCTLPELPSINIDVPKVAGETRPLTMMHFELELMGSVFASELLKLNVKRKREIFRLNSNIFSYGYLQPPDNPSDLIYPWLKEYSNFKNKLFYFTNINKTYEVVYSDDIKQFYPSINENLVSKIIEKSDIDKRIIKNIINLSKAEYYFDSNSKERLETKGLAQGPIISHLVAASVLLELDEIVAKSFTLEECVLVRYCDDVIFFFKNEEVFLKYKNTVQAVIEKQLQIIFHKDTDLTNKNKGKTYKGTLGEYREKRFKDDLLKYEVRFKAELAELSQEEREDLLNLMVVLFRKSHKKLLSEDPAYELKDIERQVSSLAWKIPLLVKNIEGMEEKILELKKLLLQILEHRSVSWKFQTNVLLIYLGFIRFYEGIDFVDELISSDEIQSEKSLLTNLIWQCVRIFMIEKDLKVFDLMVKLSNALNTETESFSVNYLKRAITSFQTDKYVTSDQDLVFGLDISGYMSSGYYFEKIMNPLNKMDWQRIKEVLFNSGSEFSMYKIIFEQHIEGVGTDNRDMKEIFEISSMYKMDDISSILLHSFERNNVENVNEKLISFVHQRVSKISDYINNVLETEDMDIKVLKKKDYGLVISVGENFYIYEFSKITNSKHFLNKLNQVVKNLKDLGLLGDTIFEVFSDSNYAMVLHKIGKKSEEEYISYFDHSRSLYDAVQTEQVIVKSSPNGKWGSQIVPAKCIYVNGKANSKVVVRNLIEVVKCSIRYTYKTNTGASWKVIKGCTVLPGHRLYDFILNKNKLYVKNNKEADQIILATINKLSPDKKWSKKTNDLRKVSLHLESLALYRSYLDDLDYQFSATSLSNYLLSAYNLYKYSTQAQKLYRARKHNNMESRSKHYELIYKELTNIVNTYVRTKSQSFNFSDSILESNCFNTKDHRDMCMSPNMYLAWNVYMSASEVCRSSVPEYVWPVMINLKICSIYIFVQELSELVERLSDENVSNFYEKENIIQNLMYMSNDLKRNYYVPILTNYCEKEEILDKYFNGIFEKCFKVLRNSDLSLYLVKNGKFSPCEVFEVEESEIENEIMKKFNIIRLSGYLLKKDFFGGVRQTAQRLVCKSQEEGFAGASINLFPLSRNLEIRVNSNYTVLNSFTSKHYNSMSSKGALFLMNRNDKSYKSGILYSFPSEMLIPSDTLNERKFYPQLLKNIFLSVLFLIVLALLYHFISFDFISEVLKEKSKQE